MVFAFSGYPGYPGAGYPPPGGPGGAFPGGPGFQAPYPGGPPPGNLKKNVFKLMIIFFKLCFFKLNTI